MVYTTFEKEKEIIDECKTNRQELDIILNYQNGYKYNTDPGKFDKHFPKDKFTTYSKMNTNYNGKNRTISLMKGNLQAQLKHIITKTHECYARTSFADCDDSMLKKVIEMNEKLNGNVSLPSNSGMYPRKFSTSNAIRKVYPGLFFFKTIYAIKNNSLLEQLDLKNKKICGEILVCIGDDPKVFNIMFAKSNDSLCDNILTEKLIKIIYDESEPSILNDSFAV